MSWGTELWDQYDALSSHTQKGIDFCEKFGHFIKERCSIEQDYAKNLKRLVKKYQPKNKEEAEYQFTTTQAFRSVNKEIHDIASQHETVSEELSQNVYNGISTLIQDLKQERKKHLQEGAKLQKDLQDSYSSLDKSKKQYDKAFRESERAADAYKKADADKNLSRADVERAQNNSIIKSNQCEECKNEYASQLHKTNDAQSLHFTQSMPQVFQQLQDMEEKRGNQIKDFINAMAKIERDVVPIVNICIDGMVKSAESIDPAKDSSLVTERYKSGLVPPGDIEFEDLSNTLTLTDSSSVGSLTPKNEKRSDTFRGTSSGKTKKQRSGLRGLFSGAKGDDTKEDYSHLPPNQQKRELNKKLEKIKEKIARATAEHDGMTKMREVYEQNTKLGDPATLDAKLEENNNKLIHLKEELLKYEGFMAECQGLAPPKSNNGVVARGSYSDNDSITRSASDISVNTHNQQNPSPQPSTNEDSSAPNQPENAYYNESKDSPDSGVVNITTEATYNEHDSFDDSGQPIGTCHAVYPFDPVNEGTIKLETGAELYVIERDNGDGWTRLRTFDGSQEGYAPTSYIEITWY